jgi:hypothetical protein
MVAVAAALRAAFPAGRYILATATGATSMYGEGDFAAARPTWSSSKGQDLAMARSPAGQQLDLVTIMAYLIGELRQPAAALAALPATAAVTSILGLMCTCMDLDCCSLGSTLQLHKFSTCCSAAVSCAYYVILPVLVNCM